MKDQLYVNTLTLFSDAMSGRTPDPRRLLSEVDAERICADLKRRGKDLPRALKTTNDFLPEENFRRLPDRVQTRHQRIYRDLIRHPEHARKSMAEVQRMLSEYPDVPAFHNLLSVCCKLAGDQEQYRESILDTRRRFPEYLFGKTSLADYYLDTGEWRRVPEALENKLDITEHFPAGHETYHASQVRSFYGILGRYFVLKGDIARAIACYWVLEAVDPDHGMTKLLAGEIYLDQHARLTKRARRVRKGLG